MMKETEKLQRMDVCRPDSSDWELLDQTPLRDELEHDEGLLRTFQKSQQFDRAVRGAMQDVAIPDGLSDRLLQSLSEADPADTGSADTGSATNRDEIALSARRRRFSLSVAAGLAALAASLFLSARLVHWTVKLPPAGRLAEAAFDWPKSLEPAAWRDVNELTVQQAQPPYRQLSVVAKRWQPISTDFAPAICYELAASGGQAYVFVLPPDIAEVSATRPPQQPTVSTRGWCIGVWTADEHTYVVMVEGSQQRYGRLVGRADDLVATIIAPDARNAVYFN